MNESSLARFQSDFAAALFGDGRMLDAAMARLAAQPAFAVYRNGVMKSAVDALQGNFPTVTRLVGDDWFRAAACEFVRHSPPASPVLLEYGADFPAFLAGFAPAADLPYLADVARLDRMWTEAHVAADATPLAGATLAALSPEALAATELRLHPATRWAWFDDMPVHTLWDRNRTASPIDEEIPWVGEGTLLTRPAAAVVWHRIDRAACAFLAACLDQASVAEAAQAAINLDPNTDLRELMRILVGAGAFQHLSLTDPLIGDTP